MVDKQKIEKNLIKYTGPFGLNSYLIKDKKNLLIDAFCSPKDRVEYLILTHCHFDHVFLANKIKNWTGCQILATKETAKHLRKMDKYVALGLFGIINAEPIIVDEFIKEGDIIKTGQFSFKILEVPGHAPGGIAIWEPKRKILFSGDIWFGKEFIGRWDLPGGNEKKLLSSVEKLKSLNPKILCPGHMEVIRF